MAPLAGLVWLLSRLVAAEKREENHLDVVNSRSILNGGYYALVEAVKRPEVRGCSRVTRPRPGVSDRTAGGGDSSISDESAPAFRGGSF